NFKRSAQDDYVAIGHPLRQSCQLADALPQESAELLDALALVLSEAELSLHAFHEIKAALVEKTHFQ
ncbi:hypothetical protein JTL66_35795, partial [Pseudomonas aeruginosa]|nr:hypothetical protein [Pseudomonas aeruginosa]